MTVAPHMNKPDLIILQPNRGCSIISSIILLLDSVISVKFLLTQAKHFKSILVWT